MAQDWAVIARRYGGRPAEEREEPPQQQNWEEIARRYGGRRAEPVQPEPVRPVVTPPVQPPAAPVRQPVTPQAAVPPAIAPPGPRTRARVEQTHTRPAFGTLGDRMRVRQPTIAERGTPRTRALVERGKRPLPSRQFEGFGVPGQAAPIVGGFQEPTTPPTFGQSFGRGVDISQQLWYSSAEATGELLGLETLEQFGEKGRKRKKEEIEAEAPRMQFAEVRSPRDLYHWFKGVVGEQIPIMTPMMVSGAAGAKVGAVTGAALGPGGAAAGATIGGLLGAFVPSLALGVGEVQAGIKERGEEHEEPGAAFLGGTAIAALDSVLPGKVGSQIARRFGKEVGEVVARRFLSRVVHGGAKGLTTETLTEGMQEAIEDVSSALATGGEISPDLPSRIREASAAGGAMGLFGGGAGAAVDVPRAAPTPQPTPQATPPPRVQPAAPEATPEPAPQVSPPEVTPGAKPPPSAILSQPGDYEVVGYRYVEGTPQVGSRLGPSRVWEETPTGWEPTTEEDKGTSAFETLEQAEEYAKYSPGAIVEIGGRNLGRGAGQLAGELLVGDAQVLRVIRPAKEVTPRAETPRVPERPAPPVEPVRPDVGEPEPAPGLSSVAMDWVEARVSEGENPQRAREVAGQVEAAGLDLDDYGSLGEARDAVTAPPEAATPAPKAAEPVPTKKRPPKGELEPKKATKHFQPYTSEERANRAASHRLGPVAKRKLGETFWTHPDIPDRGFPTKKAAEQAAKQKGVRRGDPTLSRPKLPSEAGGYQPPKPPYIRAIQQSSDEDVKRLAQASRSWQKHIRTAAREELGKRGVDTSDLRDPFNEFQAPTERPAPTPAKPAEETPAAPAPKKWNTAWSVRKMKGEIASLLEDGTPRSFNEIGRAFGIDTWDAMPDVLHQEKPDQAVQELLKEKRIRQVGKNPARFVSAKAEPKVVAAGIDERGSAYIETQTGRIQATPADAREAAREAGVAFTEAERVRAALPEGPASTSDISLEAARSAYQWNSMDPERRAKTEQREYVNHVNSLYQDHLQRATTPEQRAALDTAIEEYRRGYLDRLGRVRAARGRTASSMVTGPANFPTARNQRALETERKRFDELMAWDRKARQRVAEAVSAARSPEQATDEWGTLKKRLDRDIATAKAIDQGADQFRGFDRRAFVTSVTQRLERLANKGQTDLVRRALEYIDEQQKGWKKPFITKRNKVWKLADVAQQAEKKQEAAETTERESPAGFTVVENVDLDRLQLQFDGKPDADTRNLLKRSGFRWSPRNQAWQRKLTDNARASMRSIEAQLLRDQPAPVAAATQPVASAPQFAERVLDLTRTHHTGPFEHKTPIAALYDAYREQHGEDAGTLEAFKQRLQAAAGEGLLSLASLDDPTMLPDDMRDRSEIKMRTRSLHFVERRPQETQPTLGKEAEQLAELTARPEPPITEIPFGLQPEATTRTAAQPGMLPAPTPKRPTGGGAGEGMIAASEGGLGTPGAPGRPTTIPRPIETLIVPPEGGSLEQASTALPVEFPELVEMARELIGTPQVVRRFRKEGKLGEFRPQRIRIAAELFTPGREHELAAVLAHEIGHAVDWLPHGTLKRGNILGRLLSLQSFLKHTFTAPDGQTIKLAEVRAELKELSRQWRPWNRSETQASFVRYRDSSRELYADALSALLRDPGRVQSVAPTFYQQFFEHLNRKPQVHRAYFDMQAIMSGSRAKLIGRRVGGDREMVEGADVDAIELEKRKENEKKLARGSLYLRVKMDLVDRNYAMIDAINDMKRRGVQIPEHEDPRYLVSERNYLGGKIKGLVQGGFDPIHRAIEGRGINWHDFGLALLYERVIYGDRSELGNPRGLTVSDAEERYAFLRRQWSREQQELVSQAIDEFRTVVRSVAEEAYQAGLYSDELYQQMRDNPAYATFQVVDYLENGVTSKVYKQIGTLKDITNPANATIAKTIVTKAALEYNKVKRDSVRVLEQNPDLEIEDAKLNRKTGQFLEPRGPKAVRQKLVTYLDKGKLVGKYVDPWIATSLENNSVGYNNAISRILGGVNSAWFRPIYTTLNVGFQAFNVARDLGRFWKAMSRKGDNLSLAQAIRLYWKSVPLARVRAFGLPEKPTEAQLRAFDDLVEAERAGILSVTFNDLVLGRHIEETEIEDILQRSGLTSFRPEERRKALRPFVALVEGIKNLGDFVETLPKASGIYHFKGDGAIADIGPRDRAFIREKLGSPDFLAGGVWKPVTNNLMLFSNAIIQAWRSDLAVATDPETRAGYWWKTIELNVVPKMLMFAAQEGMWPEDADFDSECGGVRQVMRGASEYDKTNYTIVPLGFDEHCNGVYVRLPGDDSGRLVGGLTWKAMRAARGDAEIMHTLTDVVDYTAGQVPSVAPVLELVPDVVSFASGRNIYDNFRGRMVFTDDELEAQDWHTVKKFIGHEFQQLGGGIVWKFYPGELPPRQQSKGQKILEAPILSNVVGRFVKITNYGEIEALRNAEGDVGKEEARRRLTERDRLYAAMEQYQALPEGEQSIGTQTRMVREIAQDLYGEDRELYNRRFPVLRTQFRVGLLRGGLDPLVAVVLSAETIDKKVAVLLKAKTYMSDPEFDGWLEMARRNRVLTSGTARRLRRAMREAETEQ